ncbi:MAG: STAS-like domain-containing protein [Anaerolineales bacterium]|nr:MAG: STAS-like domain-containing protein [Anaerolineales bacterium]
MSQRQRLPNVKRDNEKLILYALNHPAVVSEFLRLLRYGISKGFDNFSLVFSNHISGAFPNACVPIAGIIEYYRGQGLEIDAEIVPDLIKSTSILSPLRVFENENLIKQAPLSKVWKFENSSDIHRLVDCFAEEVSRQAFCGKDVIESLEWSLNEVMDNVLQHSSTSTGYIMGQIHNSTKHVALCIFDTGQGIYNSLRNSKHSPRSPLDAITLAVKKGVTRDEKIGQGNGLWGLHYILQENTGFLSITSNSASYVWKGNEIKSFERLPFISKNVGSTSIDFQINYDKDISLSKIFGHRPVNLRLEAKESDQGTVVYRLSEETSGTGTRQSGERARNSIENLYLQTYQIVEIDFENISVISSSFADELIGKLVAKYGFFGFTQIFKLKNMNEIIQSIVNRSVAQRMMVTFVSDDAFDE